VHELERVAKRGLRGGLIWGAAPEELPYSDPAYNPFWTAAQDLRLPVSLHILTERRGGFGFRSVMRGYPALHHAVERSLADIVFAGVLERFPNLKLLSAEHDIGWIAHYLQRIYHSDDKCCYLEGCGIQNR